MYKKIIMNKFPLLAHAVCMLVKLFTHLCYVVYKCVLTVSFTAAAQCQS